MNDDKHYIIELNKTIGSLTAKIEDFCETLTKHELRLLKLEEKQTTCLVKQQHCVDTDTSLKDQLLKLLAKGCCIALLVIATLTGAGPIISSFFK